jgi:hypothetical protein
MDKRDEIRDKVGERRWVSIRWGEVGMGSVGYYREQDPPPSSGGSRVRKTRPKQEITKGKG